MSNSKECTDAIDNEIRNLRVELQNMAHSREYAVYNKMTLEQVGSCIRKESVISDEINKLEMMRSTYEKGSV